MTTSRGTLWLGALAAAIVLALAGVFALARVSPDRRAGAGGVPEDGPALVGQLGGAATAVGVDGNRVYAAIGRRLVALDVSDPTTPALLGQSPMLAEDPFLLLARDAAERERRRYEEWAAERR